MYLFFQRYLIMDPAVVKSWLTDNLAEASRSPRITIDKRILSPVRSCNKGGVIAAVYTDPTTKEYYAHIGGVKLGFFPGTLTWDTLLTQISQKYVAALR